VIADDRLDTLDPEQLRQAMRELMAEIARKEELIEQHRREAVLKQATQRPSSRTKWPCSSG
jgi:multidrug resistance efflux pump